MKKNAIKIHETNSVLKLIAAITPEQHLELERFAENRLRRATASGTRRRAAALFCSRSILNSVFEKYAKGDAGLPGGRILKPYQRERVEDFLNVIRGAINSVISHAVEKSEYQADHISIIVGDVGCKYSEPISTVSPALDLEMRDLEHRLFARVTQMLHGDSQLFIAMESLRNDCATGHVSGFDGEGVSIEAKRTVRKLAKSELLKLLQ